MQIPTDHIVARIEAIQARIAEISGAAPAAAPAAVSPLPQRGFASALQRAAEIGPDGSPVRPLSTGAASYGQQISQAAARYGVDPGLVQAVMQVESGGDPRAVSRAGAMGLMQLMPANVSEAGISDPFDPAQNIDAGARQLSSLMGQFGGNLDLALAAYNAGPNAVKKFGGVPPYPETQEYIRKVRAAMDKP